MSERLNHFTFLNTDIDECTAGFSDCDVDAVCTNTEGSYYCSCKPGFTGDGKDCTGEVLSLTPVEPTLPRLKLVLIGLPCYLSYQSLSAGRHYDIVSTEKSAKKK